jgi:hypothetical protein
MMTPTQVAVYVKAQPFCPFRLHMASGKTFDIRHPEMVKVGKNFLLVFSFDAEAAEFAERWESVSLMLTESISHLDQPVRAYKRKGSGPLHSRGLTPFF